jgi:thiol-disulfide isomerase/thioredoxin
VNQNSSQRLILLLALAAAFGLGSTWWLHLGSDAGASLTAKEAMLAGLGSRIGATPGASAPGVSISTGALMATSLPDPAGMPHAFAEWQGRPLVINFWATWCDPCRAELPLLSAAAQRPELRGATVLGVALDEKASVQDFLKTHPLGFPVLIDADSVGQALVARLGDADGALPFTAIVDRHGVVVETRRGPWKAGEIEARLATLL